MLHRSNALFLSYTLNTLINMKGIIVFLSGQVAVASLKGFGGGWVGSEKSFRRKDWETHTENKTTPYLNSPLKKKRPDMGAKQLQFWIHESKAIGAKASASWLWKSLLF